MMKGLFNYEEAFRKYTHAVLTEFVVNSNIQYAEIRPNSLASNILQSRDGFVQGGNRQTVEIGIEEHDRFQAEQTGGYFAGLYCMPRSFSNKQIKNALQECLDFKKEWPAWIASTCPAARARIAGGRAPVLTISPA
jgi:adenosine deaminase CECR1